MLIMEHYVFSNIKQQTINTSNKIDESQKYYVK